MDTLKTYFPSNIMGSFPSLTESLKSLCSLPCLNMFTVSAKLF